MAVASAGSISRAADNLHIAQPALSLQIKNIEDDLGVQLFDRTPKGVTPTAAGARFLVHAIDILKRIDVAYEDVQDAVNEPTGRVALGLPQSIAKILTVPLVAEILRRWPKIQFQMIELSSGYIPGYLVNGHIDIGLTFGADEGSGLRVTHLVDEDLVFVTSPAQIKKALGNAAADLKEIELAELQRFAMILPTGVHSLRNRIDEFLTARRLSLNVVAEVNTIPQLIELAASGVGSTILSYASVIGDRAEKRLATLRIVEPRLFRTVYLCRSASAPLSIATALVQDLLTETVKMMVASGTWPTGRDDGGKE